MKIHLTEKQQRFSEKMTRFANAVDKTRKSVIQFIKAYMKTTQVKNKLTKDLIGKEVLVTRSFEQQQRLKIINITEKDITIEFCHAERKRVTRSLAEFNRYYKITNYDAT